MKNESVNRIKGLMKNEKYIEKKVNALSIYNVYWCLYELRERAQLPTETVLKNDSFCKLQLIRILKEQRYSVRSLNIFLEVSAENSIPLPYVKWFYEDARAALWLKMVLENTINSSEPIISKSDISIFIHDVIFNKKLLVLNGEIVDGNSDSQIAFKKITLEKLKDAYLLSRVNSKDIKWLTSKSNSSVKTNHIYQYMNKLHDLNNLRRNKESKKKNGGRKTHINKAGCQQALICSGTIKFKETDTAMRLCHILASLDYWMFDTYWLYKDGDFVDREKANNRMLFISNMEDVWNSKHRRDRNKIKKNQGMDLTNDNKKNLKHLAKACGKTQREVLNDLVESAYSQMRNQEIKLSPSFPDQYKAFDKITLEKPSSLPSEHTEREVISEDTFLTKDKQELSSDYDAESVGSSTYDNEDVPAETITPKQEVQPFQPFYPKVSDRKPAEDKADTNTENYNQL
ncbi:hypothetical protein [Psychrobacter celer]|uniref:hypothetical protein n=1 Tax=Psychrobacter celer TaxID=306572 RepID=UPI003FCF2A7A